jgi:hypothetical protein
MTDTLRRAPSCGIVPTISRFHGIAIRMYWSDHPPPHFHAIYSGRRASFSIDSLELISGALPSRVVLLILKWAAQHQAELKENWERCTEKIPPEPIAPLE